MAGGSFASRKDPCAYTGAVADADPTGRSRMAYRRFKAGDRSGISGVVDCSSRQRFSYASTLARCWPRPGFQLFDPFQCPCLEPGRIVSDGRLSGSLHLRESAIQRRDQFEQFTYGPRASYDHRRPRDQFVWARDEFQISPQFVHRQ